MFSDLYFKKHNKGISSLRTVLTSQVRFVFLEIHFILGWWNRPKSRGGVNFDNEIYIAEFEAYNSMDVSYGTRYGTALKPGHYC